MLERQLAAAAAGQHLGFRRSQALAEDPAEGLRRPEVRLGLAFKQDKAAEAAAEYPRPIRLALVALVIRERSRGTSPAIPREARPAVELVALESRPLLAVLVAAGLAVARRLRPRPALAAAAAHTAAAVAEAARVLTGSRPGLAGTAAMVLSG